jgi:hypothetical protein
VRHDSNRKRISQRTISLPAGLERQCIVNYLKLLQNAKPPKTKAKELERKEKGRRKGYLFNARFFGLARLPWNF